MFVKYCDNNVIREREKKIEDMFSSIPYRYCFITGSFIFKKKYKDIDVFVITRSKKKVELKDKKIKIQTIDFNDTHSLFYHSIAKCCVAKNILPTKEVRATIADYWSIINEAIPTILNEKRNYKKYIRDVVLYTEYFKAGIILSSEELNDRINKFKDFMEVMDYIKKEVPAIIRKKARSSYIKRFFYTESGGYKDLLRYDSHRFLYDLSHSIIESVY